MSPITHTPTSSTKVVCQNNSDSDNFYFRDGCMYTKVTVCKLLKSKAADSKLKLKMLVSKIIEEDHQDAFSYLIQNQYNMNNVLNDEGQTAVHLAFYKNSRKILFLLGLYLENTHNNDNYSDNNCLTYLHVACYMDNASVAKKFLDDGIMNKGMDIDLPLYLDFQSYKSNLSLLHFAVTQSSGDVIKLLLEYGASVNSVDALGRTPLHVACSIYELSEKYHGLNVEIMKILLENGSDANAKDKNNNTSLMSLFPDDYYEFLEFKTECFFGVPLFLETLKKFELLALQDVDMNAINSNGDTILHLVIRNIRLLRCPTDHPIISFADSAHLEMVRLILNSNQKVNVDVKNNCDETPIELAVASMSENIVEMLLNYGVDLNNLKFNCNDLTCFYHPLFVPNLKSIRQVFKIIAQLLSHGFKLSFQDNFAVLKFLVHDYDECECASVHELPNNCNQRIYLIHLLHYGSPKHIKHIFNKALCQLSLTCEEAFMECIYLLIGEYSRYVKMGDIFVDKEVYKIIEDFDKIYHATTSSLKAIGAEVDRMKNTKLKNNVTLYDIMVENPNDICEMIKNNFTYSTTEKFFHYKDIIEGHIAKALIRIYVANSASDYLQQLMYPPLPQHCCKIIVDYLSNEDVLFMYAAYLTF